MSGSNGMAKSISCGILANGWVMQGGLVSMGRFGNYSATQSNIIDLQQSIGNNENNR